MKIPGDLDFLDRLDLVVEKLGFSLRRNPYAMKTPLDAIPAPPNDFEDRMQQARLAHARADAAIATCNSVGEGEGEGEGEDDGES